ncbi:di-heme-cytochrome C peroxidase [Algibacillus agarilyticus]|uniref:di-heme-cytochrome C peroxidase n=1 Tax=Algibacillus agarilyticus TaxID=2234133 RepID=UPI000DCFCE95|nr:di-heme-cytochrome C peroxidase [Algibacillus agarilyticus]
MKHAQLPFIKPFIKKSVFTLLALTALGGCSALVSVPADRGAQTTTNDLFGDNTQKIAYLDQGWSAEDSEWFYTTTQGSDLISYWLYLNLEDEKSAANNIKLFSGDANVKRFRYLAQKPTENNPDGLPVGFVKDVYKGKEYVGFTCAACHTGQIDFNGTGMRIDGGPTMANMDLFLNSLQSSLNSTLNDEIKLERLAQRANKTVDEVKAQVATDHTTIKDYNTTNYSENMDQPIEYGYARLDAFGRIFNRVLSHLTPDDKENRNSANAPVSYPFLWDAPYQDFVQWNGIGDNGAATAGLVRLGPLGRNVGEVLGVFATFTLEPGKNQYVSSADKINLENLERRLLTLWSPTWQDAVDKKILPPIDQNLAAKGKQVYKEYQCAACHEPISHEERKSVDRKLITQFTSYPYLGTDPQMMNNAAQYCGDAGYLLNDGVGMCGSSPKEVPVVGALSSTVASVITTGDPDENFLHRTWDTIKLIFSANTSNPISDTERHVDLEVGNRSNLMAYKGRPLNGVWATAPFLHNGSVVNLTELFMPTCHNQKQETPKEGVNCRSNSFTVGTREFDAVNVGFVKKSKANYPDLFVFDTHLPGNLNSGHEYAAGITPMIAWDENGVKRDEKGNILTYKFKPITAEKRKALVEYVKTL